MKIIKENKKKMLFLCVKEIENAIAFYKKKGEVFSEKGKFTIVEKEYSEVAFFDDL